MPNEHPLVGRWQQVKPNPHPAAIFITFLAGGTLRYTIEADTIQHILLTWRVDGDVIVSDQPSAPQEECTRFWFPTPLRLALEKDGEITVYERLEGK